MHWLIHSFLELNLKITVCTYDTFENNLGIDYQFEKYLKENCRPSSNQHFSFKYFPKDALVKKIYPKSSGIFFAMYGHEWVKGLVIAGNR